MKKIMNKKVNVFGKTVPVFVLVLLGIGLVSAALVPYLSNMVSGTVDVDSPIALTITESDSGATHTPTSFSIEAGEAFNLHTIDFEFKNGASTSINTIIKIVTIGAATEFDSTTPGIEFEVYKIGRLVDSEFTDADCTNNYGTYNDYSDDYCYWDATGSPNAVVSGDYIYLFGGDISSPGTLVSNGETILGKVKLQFKINVAPDTYTFEARAMNPNINLLDSASLE